MNWEHIYLAESPESFAVERRSRGSTGRPCKLPKEAEEDLLAEEQRLRAESAYLKKASPDFEKRATPVQKALVVQELRQEFSQAFLLKIVQLPRASLLSMATSILNKAFATIPGNANLILHSVQGWQYPHKHYQACCKRKVTTKHD